MPKLAALAPLIWARWGGIFLDVLRRAALQAADGLAFEAMNSPAGVRTLLIVCTTDRAQIRVLEQALELRTVARPADWQTYTVAELIFKTDKGSSGLGHQERCDASGGSALVLCATRPGAVQALERLCDLPA